MKVTLASDTLHDQAGINVIVATDAWHHEPRRNQFSDDGGVLRVEHGPCAAVDDHAGTAKDVNAGDVRRTLDASRRIDIGIADYKASGNTNHGIGDRRSHLADRFVVRKTTMA